MRNPGQNSTELRCIALLVALMSLNGCDSPTAVQTPLLQTDAPSYTLVRSANGFETEIRYVFTNRTGGAVYLVNCQGSYGLLLERYDGEKWKPAWSPVIPACLSLPIVIARGETFAASLRVWGARPGQSAHPQFDRADPSGTYRIVWTDALSSYQDHLPFGAEIPLESRMSNSFKLVLPSLLGW
jgi:hypothetical protein